MLRIGLERALRSMAHTPRRITPWLTSCFQNDDVDEAAAAAAVEAALLPFSAGSLLLRAAAEEAAERAGDELEAAAAALSEADDEDGRACVGEPVCAGADDADVTVSKAASWVPDWLEMDTGAEPASVLMVMGGRQTDTCGCVKGKGFELITCCSLD